MSQSRVFISYGHGGETRYASSLIHDLPERVAAAEAQMHNLLKHYNWVMSAALRWQNEPHPDMNTDFLRAQADTDVAQFKFLHEMLRGLFSAAKDQGYNVTRFTPQWQGLTERGNDMITRHQKFLAIFHANAQRNR